MSTPNPTDENLKNSQEWLSVSAHVSASSTPTHSRVVVNIDPSSGIVTDKSLPTSTSSTPTHVPKTIKPLIISDPLKPPSPPSITILRTSAPHSRISPSRDFTINTSHDEFQKETEDDLKQRLILLNNQFREANEKLELMKIQIQKEKEETKRAHDVSRIIQSTLEKEREDFNRINNLYNQEVLSHNITRNTLQATLATKPIEIANAVSSSVSSKEEEIRRKQNYRAYN